MSRKFIIIAVVVIVAASLAGGFRARATHRRAAKAVAHSASQVSATEKYEADKVETDFRDALATVQNKYAGEIDYERATQAAIQGMLSTLDPHSLYFPAADFKKLKEDQASSFYG